MAGLPDKNALLAEVRAHRDSWSGGQKPAPEPAGPGEESVWDYPRPPEIRTVDFGTGPLECRVVLDGRDLARSSRVLRVCETAGAPVYYFPPEDVCTETLKPTSQISVCEWKGAAVYYDIVGSVHSARNAAFAYPDPFDDLGIGFEQIAGWFGFYCARVDACFVGDEKATPQPGGVYAGWVTHHIKGPIKGAPGTSGW